MKIVPKSKKAIPPPPPVAELISKFLSASNEELVTILKQVDAWKWPRSDLNAWIKVLNKFDDIMDTIIREYNVEKLQLVPFPASVKDLLSEILRFERLLLENSTNRKTFSSYDRLNCLLSTSDLDILILALNLLLRPSQQYSAQPSVSHALSISTTRLQSLAKRWPHLHEHDIGLVNLASSKHEELEGVPPEALEVNFSFYRTDAVGTADDKKAEESADASTSGLRKATTAAPSSSAVQIRLDEQTVLAQPVMNVVADAIRTYTIPDSETFELLCRVRAAAALSSGKKADREKLVVIRLLAIAIYGHTHSETQATSAMFLYEPDLVGHIAELLQVDQGIPIPVQTAAIAALDAIARYKNKLQEVLTAVNAGVNHGVLMALVRSMVAEVANPESRLPHAFVEALLSFITYLASHASGGNMVVSAGLIPLLIQIIENKTPARLPVISKTMQLVDNVLYSFTNAFSLFCSSRGVDVLVERIEYEINFNIKEYATGHQPCALSGLGELPIQRIAVLKHILRSMHRMMQSSGTAEGLRGLIDMSLLKSIKNVVEYRGLFGPNVFPLAINIMSTFVHNEPTSLAIIQETGLPEMFYKAIEVGIDPAIEVIQAIPNAIGALCLNDVGQAQLAKRPSILPAIFAIFTSERHLKVLIDKENAVIIGTAVDELIRHHPSLKYPVFDALKATLGHIEELGSIYTCPGDIKHWYQLVPVSGDSSSSDVTMQDVSASPEEITIPEEPAGDVGEDDHDEDDVQEKSHDNIVVSFIDILGRFLEGFFQHPPHCKDFVLSTDGLKRIGRLTGLPCLPYDFANSVASDSMVQVLRTMTEVATSETLIHLSEIVKASLDETKFFWDPIEENSKLLPFVDVTGEETEVANQRFRSLVTLHIRITLLSDVFATAGQAQGRAAIGLLQTLMNSTPLQVLSDLGSLHRTSIWENIALHAGLASKGLEVPSSPELSPDEGSPNPGTTNLPTTDGAVPSNGTNATNGALPDTGGLLSSSALTGSQATGEGPRKWNASSLKHLTQGLPNALAPFFQAMVKMFHARRNPDATQKKQITASSKIVADIMLKHLGINHFGDKASLFGYYSAIFELFNLLLVDERTSTVTLHTVELFAFYQTGAFNAVFEICDKLISKIDEIDQVKEDVRTDVQKKELVHAYTAIKLALHLIHPIISSKPLFESGQTLLITTRDKKDTDPDYFEPHNFLVKLRFAALPTIRRLWESPWLIRLPLGVSRYVIRPVLELAKGESEEFKGDTSGELGSVPPPARSTGPDEARIRILTDMGFPRSAAHRALVRTNNNVNSATELLLSQPFPLPPDPDPIPEPLAEEAEPTAGTLPEEVTMADESAESTTPNTGDADSPIAPPASAEADTVVAGKSMDEWRKELDEAREPLKAGISKQSLILMDEHLSLLWDLHSAFTKPGTHQQRAIRELVDDIKAFSACAYDLQEQPLANRCRLLALVLCETPSSLDQELRNTLMDHLLALLLSSRDPEHPPKWLAAHLLVSEALFTLAEEPRVIAVPKQDEPIVKEPIPSGPARTEARTIVFDFCLRLLAIEDLPADELLSVLRLFVLLTRDRDMAALFIKRDGLTSLFRRIKRSAVTGGSSYVANILRHVVEDAPAIQSIMQQTIERYFGQHRNRIVDVVTYVRNCSAIALRDADIFMDVTKSLCEMENPFSSPHIKLQVDGQLPDKSPVSGGETAMDMVIDAPQTSSSASQKSVDAVIHLLIAELMNAAKEINEAPSTVPPSLDVRPPQELKGAEEQEPPTVSEGPTQPTNSVVDVNDRIQYVCFIMQCLTELLFSYDSCKVAFLSYSTKKRPQQTPSKEPNNKFRTVTLHFLLSELVTYGTISPLSDPKYRNRGTLCSWAMNVIGALCVDTSAAQEMKEISNDLLYVRKFVLETVSRAIKDVSSTSENVEARYGRLLALADLCHRLLTVRVNPNSRKQSEDIPTHLAKIMLEKNFVSVLTSALSEVDLNYPNVRNLVASILRPLEYLSKIAIKMSKASGRNKEDAKEDVSVSSASDEEDEAMEVNARQETPDLYRNSALGIYSGEMDDRQFSDDDDMDDEDEEQDVEMDYGEDTGSEDTSESDSEPEEGVLDSGSQESGEAWNEVDEVDEEDLVENEGDDDEDHDHEEDADVDDDAEEGEGEGEDEEDEDEEGMRWEDIQEVDGLGMDLENIDDEPGHGVPIQVNHEEDEPDLASDEEEFLLDNGNFGHDGIFSFGAAFVNGTNAFVHRRPRHGADHHLFGRPRNPSTAPEAITHPLLLDMSTASRSNNNNLPRGLRNAPRLIGNPSSNFLQTINEMLGEGSIEVLEQLIHEGGEMFRIEVPAGTLTQHGRRLLGGSSSRPERTPRPQAQGREFDPLLTLPRWAEEMKILHGDFVVERVSKLANHLIVAMLPAALEAMKLAKLKEEQEVARKAEEEVARKAEEEVARKAAEEEATRKAEEDELKRKAEEETNPVLVVETPDAVESPMEEQTSVQPELQTNDSLQDATMAETTPVDVDSEMADASGSADTSVPPTVSDDAPSTSTSEETPAESSAAANPPERITVMIHGSAVDITDTGIDPTFLEALPDDMREEVLNQHVRDQQASRVERPPDSQISSEFLDALPPELRAEIIQQEAMERARRRTEDAPRAPTRAPADIDPASLIASLDPSLRQAVLLEQEDGFIQTLPSHMIAEAGAYRDELRARRRNFHSLDMPGRSTPSRSTPTVPPKKNLAPHDAIMLLDRPGVAILVRLLFYPQVLKKTLLFKVLVNLCENAKTRTELFNLLLGILQDGSGDLAAVDKSFAQLSVRNREVKPQMPKAVGKQKATDFISTLASPASQVETVPDLIAQRCLEALTYIVNANEPSSYFFLTEHDLPAGLRKTSGKKGKGKEKQVSQTHYPLVLLLNLLDRQSLLRTPAILESVVGLLATITRPLTSLKDQAKVTDNALPPLSESSAAEASATVPAASAPPSGPPQDSQDNAVDAHPLTGSTNTIHTHIPDLERIVSTTNLPPAVEQAPADNNPSTEATDEKALLPHPPQVPHSALCLIVNILTIGECSGRTFQQSLALIQHLSNIPDARDVIALELKTKAQDCGQILYSDLDELAVALQNSSSTAITSVAAKFSPASSTQAKLLRVLKTIDYMYTPKVSASNPVTTTTTTSNEDIEKVQTIYESFRFTPLWRRLGDCLSLIGENSETDHIGTVLLPLIESLMVVCKFVGSKGTVPRALRVATSPKSPTTPKESMEDLFITFTDAHRKVLNLMVRNNPSLMSGSFSLLVNNSRVLDFDNKRNYFNQQLHRKPHTREHHGTLQLNVRRARVFEDSFLYLNRKSGEQIKNGKLSVRFYDEEGVDAGGLTREWFQILARQMFNPDYALFQPCAADKLTYQPNKASWVNPEHLSFFKFVGRVIGKAIYDGRLLDAYFARSLYRQLLGKPVDYKDVEWVDPEYYNSLCWILENDPTVLDLNFAVEGDEFGVNKIVTLKEGGEQIPVTQENKREYVQLSAQYRLYSSIKDQIEHLLSGFYDVIPKDLITIFNEQELELLISGTPDIDVDEWRAATEYNGYTSSDPNIVWWWRALKSFNRDERAKVLSFATGTSRVPLNGFLDLQGVQGVQKFSIHRAYGEPDRLPQAHTCFNQIDLPQYTSYDMLRQQLLMAINEGGEGFAFS